MASRIQRIPRTGSAMSLATRELVQRLHTLHEGDFVGYDELKQLTSLQNQAHLIRLLSTARQYLLRTYQQVFELLPGQGVLCLSNRGKIGFAGKRRREIHTRAKKNVEILQAVNPQYLTSTEKYLHLAELSVNAATALTTHEKTVTEIEAQRQPQPILIDPSTYAHLFQGL